MPQAVPRHVAVIMDGNRRWASARGLPAIEGHRRGAGALRAAVRAAIEAGVQVLTVYGFSTENWNREPAEIAALMNLCAFFARKERRDLAARGVRVQILGDVEPFAPGARAALERLTAATAQNATLTLNLALNYSGRAEIVRAVRQLAGEVESGELRASDVNEDAIRKRFYVPATPDPDFLIRTGGDFRISNFLLYQLAYTELLTLALMWPEFTERDFFDAIGVFGERRRRFGG